MKLLLILLLLFSVNSSFDKKDDVSIQARNYIVYDANANEVLEGKDFCDSYSIASISKIMTAIIALESDRLFEIITVDEIIYTIEGSSLYLQEGDRISVIDLIYGLILRSGNDAAVLISNNICKSIDDFVLLMNEKAREIGMTNTKFSNPSGLDIFDDGNISSCLDMAILMDYCLENELFCQISSTKSYRSQLKGVWTNKNKLLHQYEYCTGGKTGYTKKARRTLITTAEKDYQKLIIVTFNCGDDFSTHKTLYEKYFNSYTYLVFLNKGLNFIDEYYIYSKEIVGLRIDKKITKGVKLYALNPINSTLKIKFISEDQQIFSLDQEFEIKYYQT